MPSGRCFPHQASLKAQARELAESAGDFQRHFDPEVWEVVQDPGLGEVGVGEEFVGGMPCNVFNISMKYINIYIYI